MDPIYWLGFKDRILVTTGLGDNALHIIVGVAAMLVSYAIFRKKGLVFCWVALLLALILNEVVDIHAWPVDKVGNKWVESFIDTLTTMGAPTLMLGVLWWRRALAARPGRAQAH